MKSNIFLKIEPLKIMTKDFERIMTVFKLISIIEERLFCTWVYLGNKAYSALLIDPLQNSFNEKTSPKCK